MLRIATMPASPSVILSELVAYTTTMTISVLAASA